MAASDLQNRCNDGTVRFANVDGEELHPSIQAITFRDKWKHYEYRRKCLRTVLLGAAFWSLGFTLSQQGPAFLDLQIITGTDVEKASFFFTSAACGYLVGSLVTGMIYDKLNKSLLMAVCLMGRGAATIVLPWCSPYVAMIFIQFVVSLFGGGMETTGNAEVLRLWGKDGETAMQFVHFAYALGGIIGPFSVGPFLTPTPHVGNSSDTLVSTASVESSMTRNVTYTRRIWNRTETSGLGTGNLTEGWTAATRPLTTNVHYAFVISGSLVLLIMIPWILELFGDRAHERRQNRSERGKEEKQPLPTGVFLFVVFTVCTFYFFYCCVEDNFRDFLSTFLVTRMKWSKTTGAEVTSLFYAFYAAFRFLSIFADRFLTSCKLLIISCWVLFFSLLAFLIFSRYEVGPGIWVATAFVGASTAPIFPTGLLWMEEELVHVTGRVSSSVLMAAASASALSPFPLGYSMQQWAPMWFAYILFGLMVVSLGLILFLVALSRLCISKRYMMRHSEEQQEMDVANFRGEDQLDDNNTVVMIES